MANEAVHTLSVYSGQFLIDLNEKLNSSCGLSQ